MCNRRLPWLSYIIINFRECHHGHHWNVDVDDMFSLCSQVLPFCKDLWMVTCTGYINIIKFLTNYMWLQHLFAIIFLDGGFMLVARDTFWTSLFTTYFQEAPDDNQKDDLLFYVRKDASKSRFSIAQVGWFCNQYIDSLRSDNFFSKPFRTFVSQPCVWPNFC